METPSPAPEQSRNVAETRGEGGGGEGRTSSRRRSSRKGNSFLAFLASDAGYEYMLIGKLFAAAYAPYVVPPLLLITASLISYHYIGAEAMVQAWSDEASRNILAVAMISTLSILMLIYMKTKDPSIYLVDFASYKSLDKYKLSTEHCVQITRDAKTSTPSNMLFQLKVLLKSGLGDDVYGPPFLFTNPIQAPSLASANAEMDHMMFGALDELLAKTSMDPSQIDFLIVNVSMFYPSPSLSSHLVHHYKMRQDVKTFNISGMGCAAGMVALDLAKDMLRVHKDKYVVVVGTENITLNWYYGNDRSMLVPNCLFRCGSYALLLSNKKSDKRRSKLELLRSVRTTTGANDKSYNVIFTKEDDEGIMGTSLSVELLDVAAKAVTISMTKLVPDFMPFSELLKVGVNALRRTVFHVNTKPYLPDFKKAFNHFCLHPGGKAVVDGIAKSLKLSDYDVEPAKMSLHRFGNTSSSGLWYAMAYCEAKERLKRGDKVWQLALGSGFKCNSVVWKVLRDVKPVVGFNPWMDCIDQYPLEVPDTIGPSHKHYEFFKQTEEDIKTFT